MQLDKLSDVTVNISIEDVINSASFGSPLIYKEGNAVSGIPYTVVSNYDEAFALITNYSTGALADFSTTASNVTTFTSNNTTFTLSAGSDVTAQTVTGTGFTVNDTEYLGFTTIEGGTTATFASTNFDTKPVLQLGVGLRHLTTESTNEDSTEAESVTAYLYKNSTLIATYTVTKDNPILIAEALEKLATTDTYYIRFSDDVYVFALGIKSVDTALMTAVDTYYMQDGACQELAICTDGEDNSDPETFFNRDWRQLVYVGADNIVAIRIANQLAARKSHVMYVLLDGTNITEAEVAELKGNERVVAFYNTKDSSTTGSKTVCALVGETASKDVGSFTYKNQSLINVPADDTITASKLKQLHNDNINTFVTKAGYNVTSEGLTMSGEYIDILDCKDWLVLQIQYQVQQCLIINDKVAYTDNGIAMLESVVANVLKEAYDNGMIADTAEGLPAYSVNFAKRADTKASDRELRRYVEGKFSFDLAGAIHTVTINGYINI